MNNYTYVTVLSTDNYIPGILALAKSLKAVNSEYPLLVLTTAKLNKETYLKLLDANIDYIEENRTIKLPPLTEQKNNRFGVGHWNNTFLKLCIFDLVKYDKLIYLDADMMVCENIDHLFESPNMSAVVAGRLYETNNHWTKLNSGLMVIEPKERLTETLIESLYKVGIDHDMFGDQEVIQDYFDTWEDDESLHLDDRYNMFVNYSDYYGKHFNYGYKGYSNSKNDSPPNIDIAVVHFIASGKPWMLSKKEYYWKLIKLFIKGKFIELRMWTDYMALINN